MAGDLPARDWWGDERGVDPAVLAAEDDLVDGAGFLPERAGTRPAPTGLGEMGRLVDGEGRHKACPYGPFWGRWRRLGGRERAGTRPAPTGSFGGDVGVAVGVSVASSSVSLTSKASWLGQRGQAQGLPLPGFLGVRVASLCGRGAGTRPAKNTALSRVMRTDLLRNFSALPFSLSAINWDEYNNDSVTTKPTGWCGGDGASWKDVREGTRPCPYREQRGASWFDEEGQAQGGCRLFGGDGRRLVGREGAGVQGLPLRVLDAEVIHESEDAGLGAGAGFWAATVWVRPMAPRVGVGLGNGA